MAPGGTWPASKHSGRFIERVTVEVVKRHDSALTGREVTQCAL
jgi:hypothetical protein